MSQVPRLADSLEDGERAVALTQRQQPAPRKPERATDERAVRSAVRDDSDRQTGVRLALPDGDGFAAGTVEVQ